MKRWILNYLKKDKDSFFFNKKILVYAFAAITMLVIIFDYFNEGLPRDNVIFNIYHSIFVAGVIIFFMARRISPEIAINCLYYTAIANLVLSHILKDPSFPDYSSHFLRTTIMLGMILPILAIANGLKHIIINMVIYFAFLIIVALKSHNAFLLENLEVLIISTLGYNYGLYYLFNEIDKEHKIQIKYSERLSEANSQLMLKNKDLEKFNNLLGQKNQKIEEQAAEMKQLLETRDKLYAIISHDLRNSLGAIKGFSELMLNHSNKINDQKLIRFSHQIMISAKRTYELLSNLLNWTRIQTGNIKIRYESFNIYHILSEIVDLYTVAINSKKIDFFYEKNEAIEVFADKNMVQMILRNIISNAIKFTPENGQININYYIENDWFVFVIKDTGIGITDDEKNRIFVLKEHYSKPGTEKEKGSGLGLLLCVDFLNLHNGELLVRSEKDKGTELLFKIPYRVPG